jgi:hypothetical protein
MPLLANASLIRGTANMQKKEEIKKPVKRTTIILDEEERRFIDALIKEGKEPGIKPLISKMLDVYRSMMIYDWKYPGEYYCGISRIAFMNVELINILLQHIPKEEWGDVWRKAGEAAKISIETSMKLETKNQEKWPDVFKRLRVQGFGDFYLRDKYIVVKAPFINSHEAWCGFLEGLLGANLEPKTLSSPFVLEIVN